MKRHKVCLDAGHGGHDSGAVGPTGHMEKDATLEVCLYAEHYLKPYVDVVMTRRTDKFLSLSDRPAIANAADADAFVSYHFNAGSSTVKQSWEIFTTRGQNRSDRLATLIGEAHRSNFGSQYAREEKSDGDLDKEANFTVIIKTKCPSCLMEGEFISTPHGEKSIKDQEQQKIRGLAVAIGVLNFLGISHSLIPYIPLNITDDLTSSNDEPDYILLDSVKSTIEDNKAVIKSLETAILDLRQTNENLKDSIRKIKY
jgi:N-acetylmuramoyl-L-alanine amidase